MADTTTPTADDILYVNATDEVVRVAAAANDNNNSNNNNAIDSHTLANLSNGFNQYLSHTFGELTNKCTEWQWQSPRHVYFQVANALFLIAFLSPHKSYGFLLCRCALVFASILMTMWSYLIECSLDALIWNGLFLFVNFIYLTVLIYQLRPIRFEKEIDAVITIYFCSRCCYFYQKFFIDLIDWKSIETYF